MSLLFSVMSLVLSWNSSTERSEGEVFHGFYFFLSMSCLWSCQDMESGQNMERRQVLSCTSLTECSKGELFHGFYFFLSMVLSLLISVMTLVLSWNSSTERSEGEVFHGFYFFLSLSCLWSCQDIERGQNMERCQNIEMQQDMERNQNIEMCQNGKVSEYAKVSGPVM